MTEQKRYTLRNQYLELNKYDHAQQECKSYDSIFHSWYSVIDHCYRGSGHPNIVGRMTATSTQGFTDILCQGITSFINSQIDIVNEHLLDQRDQLSNININMMVSWNQKIKVIVSRLKKLTDQKNQTITHSKQLQRKINLSSPTSIQNYATQKWKQNLVATKEYLSLIDKKIDFQEIDAQIFDTAMELQENLLRYRKKLIDFKYGNLKKGVKKSRKLLQCLSQYFSIGLVFLQNFNNKLKKEQTRIRRSSLLSRESTFMKTEVDHGYVRGSKYYLECLDNLKQLFTCIVPKNTHHISNQIIFIYSGNQQLATEITDTLHLFTLWAEEKVKIVRQIQEIITAIHLENKQIRKSIDLYLTLSKVREFSKSGDELQNSFMEKQITMEKIEYKIFRLIDNLINSYSQMGQKCLKMKQKTIQPRQNADNFSVSYIYKDIKIRNKQPSHEIRWLWRDWRKFQQNQPQYPLKKFQQKQLLQHQKIIQQILQQADQKQKYPCSLSLVREYKVKLRIFENKLTIKSKKGYSQIDLTIPFSQIQTLTQKNKGIVLRLKSKSNLVLYKFSDVEEVKQKLEEALNAGANNPNLDAQIVKKKKPELTDEDRKAIEARKSQVDKERQDMEGYVLYGQKSFKGVTIQQMFDYLVSDAGTCPLNNGSFQEYMAKKMKNKNYTETKYDSIGPGYYTGNPEVNFTNCPIFSTRQCQLDHPLPKIPFLPSECHCSQTDKILWVSEKELEYCTSVVASGSSMMESFLSKTLYRIKQNDGQTLVQLYAKTRLKSALEKGAIGQFKEIIPGIIKQIEKCVKVAQIRESRQNQKEDNGNSFHEDNKILDEESVSTRSSSKDNSILFKMLLGIAIGSIVINIIIMKFL